MAIVNQAFVTTYLRGRAALGARLRFPSGAGRPSPWFTIVGVVADVRHSNLEDAPPPQVYQSLWQTDAGSVYLAVRRPRPGRQSASADVCVRLDHMRT